MGTDFTHWPELTPKNVWMKTTKRFSDFFHSLITCERRQQRKTLNWILRRKLFVLRIGLYSHCITLFFRIVSVQLSYNRIESQWEMQTKRNRNISNTERRVKPTMICIWIPSTNKCLIFFFSHIFLTLVIRIISFHNKLFSYSMLLVVSHKNRLSFSSREALRGSPSHCLFVSSQELVITITDWYTNHSINSLFCSRI